MSRLDGRSSGRPRVEIWGPYLPNSGDLLMVRAIQQRLGGSCALSLDPGGPFDPALWKQADLPIRWTWARAWRQFGRALGRQAGGAVRWAREPVHVLLDCSGYAYGDPWGDRKARRLLGDFNRWKRRGASLIVLPQAFGPFSDSRLRNVMRDIVDAADLVFARDSVSLEHLRAIGGESPRLHLAPDFTALVPGRPPPQAAPPNVVLVPNQRMLDKTTERQAQAYVPFVVSAMKSVARRGLEVSLLVAERGDLPLATLLRKEYGGRVDVIVNDDPIVLKGVLGAAHAVIGSRYHSLIGSLSQGVPTIGTSWGHKYEALFEDYGFADGLLHDLESRQALEEKLSLILDGPSREVLSRRLRNAAEGIRERVSGMWSRIDSLLLAR